MVNVAFIRKSHEYMKGTKGDNPVNAEPPLALTNF